MSAVAAPLGCAAAGVLLGGLLPVTAYRLSVPCGEAARSACGWCAQPLPAWVRPVWRCPGCARRLGPAPALTVAAAGIAGLAVGMAVSAHPVSGPAEGGLLLGVLLLVALVGVLLAAVDLAVLRLPDVLVLPTAVVVAALLGAGAALLPDPAPVARAAAGAAAMGAGYALLALLPRSPLGFGDVKLAAVLGAPLGWLGWPAVLAGAVLPVAFGGLVSFALLAAGRIRRDTPVPFGPALVAGFLAAAVLPSA